MSTELNTMKQYICNTCISLEKKELIDILNFLKREHINNNMFNQNFDGIKINLDLLDEGIISRLYNFIQYKITKL